MTRSTGGSGDTGLHDGDVVLVHSAMRTLGRVRGGADTVVSALLEVIGERGTLVVPTFTFVHEVEDDPIIDPRSDPSEMGAITEAARTHPRALRSAAYRHSFAAIGRHAEVIAGVDPSLSVFDLRSSFGVMLALNTQILMLGMTYASCTSFHFAEWLCEVPYRRVIPLDVKVRRADGTVVPQAVTDYQPHSYTGTRRPDFNRMGRMLEERRLVGIAAVGNAVARRFAMRDLIDLAQAEADKDYNVFRTPEGGTTHATPLDSGTTVISPEMPDAAGRPDRYQWSVSGRVEADASRRLTGGGHMSTITFECPDDILRILSETPEHFADECRLLIAVKLFELGHLSSGQAARFAGMERVPFLDALKSYRVSAINLSAEDLAQDISHARNL